MNEEVISLGTHHSTIIFKPNCFEFVWNIYNLNFSSFDVGRGFPSPVFRPPGLRRLDPESTWRLWLYPLGKDEENKQYSALYLEKDSNTVLKIQGYFRFESPKTKTLAYKSYNEEIKRFLGFKNFSNVDDIKWYSFTFKLVKIFCGIYSLDSRNYSIPDGKFDIFCFKCPSVDALSKNVGSLLEDKDFWDVQLESEDKVTFNAHKLILSVRSAFFAAMFRNNMGEKETNKLNMDLDSVTLKAVLDYLYTGNYPRFDLDKAKFYLHAATRYDLRDLKDYCAEYLSQKLTCSEVEYILLLARRFAMPTLEQACISFMSWERMLEQEEEVNFDKPDLLELL